jgi:methylenetetrahydrofolate--tRNA-(uracil-5-)-methyltransferase
MIGALYRYMNEADPKHFQPMNANFGLLDELPEQIRDKKRKREKFAERSLSDMQAWIDANNIHAAALART